MSAFVAEDPSLRSSRFAVIPGVLHTDSSWGAGTTEYALDAARAAKTGAVYVLPVELDARLPMIMRDDLVRGLHLLTMAEKGALKEEGGGYAMAGGSFAARELFDAIRSRVHSFRFEATDAADEEALLEASPAALFARLWPDSLSGESAARDLGFTAKVTEVNEMADLLLGVEEAKGEL